MHRFLLLFVVLGTFCVATPSASAIEVKITAQALERTLKTPLFNGPEGRYYIRGNANSSCYFCADSPRASFKDNRVWCVYISVQSWGLRYMARALVSD